MTAKATSAPSQCTHALICACSTSRWATGWCWFARVRLTAACPHTLAAALGESCPGPACVRSCAWAAAGRSQSRCVPAGDQLEHVSSPHSPPTHGQEDDGRCQALTDDGNGHQCTRAPCTRNDLCIQHLKMGDRVVLASKGAPVLQGSGAQSLWRCCRWRISRPAQ